MEPAGEQMTLVGAAWRKSGAEPVLVVMGRGMNGGGSAPSSAVLTVYHRGRRYRFVGTAVTPNSPDSESMKTYRFEFRLPSRVQSWPIERLVLRWQQASFEVPLPRTRAPGAAPRIHASATRARADAAGAAGASWRSGSRQPDEDRYGGQIPEAEAQLVKLRQEVARLRDESAAARARRDEAHTERDRVREEREHAYASLAAMAAELKQAEQELAERRGDFEQVVGGVRARRAELEGLEAEQPSADGELAPGTSGPTEPELVPVSPPVSTDAPAQTTPRRTASPSQDRVVDAISKMRRQLERVQRVDTAPRVADASGEPQPAADGEGDGGGWFSRALHQLTPRDRRTGARARHSAEDSAD